MTPEARKAYDELLQINAPVYSRQEYGAQFLLGAELRDSNDHYFADYYGEEVKEHYHPDDLEKPHRERRILNIANVREDVWEILRKHGLYVEWINAGLAGIYVN